MNNSEDIIPDLLLDYVSPDEYESEDDSDSEAFYGPPLIRMKKRFTLKEQILTTTGDIGNNDKQMNSKN